MVLGSQDCWLWSFDSYARQCTFLSANTSPSHLPAGSAECRILSRLVYRRQEYSQTRFRNLAGAVDGYETHSESVSCICGRKEKFLLWPRYSQVEPVNTLFTHLSLDFYPGQHAIRNRPPVIGPESPPNPPAFHFFPKLQSYA